MASAPHSWDMLQAFQTTIQNEVLIDGKSPFTKFQELDAAKFGAQNATGKQTAIYLGAVPKEIKTIYPVQCWIVVNEESVYRRAFGGKVFDDSSIYVVVLGQYTDNYYEVMQNTVAIRDAFWPVLQHHTEQPDIQEVVASKQGAQSSDRKHGYWMDSIVGRDWFCWGTTRWLRQQWTPLGGFTQ